MNLFTFSMCPPFVVSNIAQFGFQMIPALTLLLFPSAVKASILPIQFSRFNASPFMSSLNVTITPGGSFRMDADLVLNDQISILEVERNSAETFPAAFDSEDYEEQEVERMVTVIDYTGRIRWSRMTDDYPLSLENSTSLRARIGIMPDRTNNYTSVDIIRWSPNRGDLGFNISDRESRSHCIPGSSFSVPIEDDMMDRTVFGSVDIGLNTDDIRLRPMVLSSQSGHPFTISEPQRLVLENILLEAGAMRNPYRGSFDRCTRLAISNLPNIDIWFGNDYGAIPSGRLSLAPWDYVKMLDEWECAFTFHSADFPSIAQDIFNPLLIPGLNVRFTEHSMTICDPIYWTSGN